VSHWSSGISRAVCLGSALLAGSSVGAAAQSNSYYAGKQIKMVIGSGAGGGYDIYARFLTRHLAKHIPGNPTIVNQNVPTASGLQATNWGYTVAPKDGTVIVATYNALLDDPLCLISDNVAWRRLILKAHVLGDLLVLRPSNL